MHDCHCTCVRICFSLKVWFAPIFCKPLPTIVHTELEKGNKQGLYPYEFSPSMKILMSMVIWQACPFGTSDVRDYSILAPDLPLLPSTSPTDLPGHISASTRLRKKYDLSIHIYISWRKYFFCQNKSLIPDYGLDLLNKNKDWISSHEERGQKRDL